MQVTVGMEGAPLARNPNVVEPLAPSAPFQARYLTVVADPVVVSVPFHSWLIDCPPASVQFVVQPLIAEVPAVTVTSPWNPPDQELTIR